MKGKPMDYSVKGRRVRLVSTSDPYTRLRSGEQGTAQYVDDAGTLHVQWDDGSHLGMVPGHDRWQYV